MFRAAFRDTRIVFLYVTLNGPTFQAILDDIGLYQVISSNIRVNFSSVKSIMCWVRSKSSCTGSGNYKPNMVTPCRIGTFTILLKITNIGRYRCSEIYIAQFWYYTFYLICKAKAKNYCLG